MNCPYCGSLLTYQDVVCPYCGRTNKGGVAFQKEVYDRIERNRLLRPFLINKKKMKYKLDILADFLSVELEYISFHCQ